MRNWLVIAASVFALSLIPGSVQAAAKGQARRAAPVTRRAPPKRASPSPTPPEKTADADDSQALRRGERVEFDARLIQGQTAKAGAVYLFERVSSDLSSMVKERRSYRREIVEEVFGQESDR